MFANREFIASTLFKPVSGGYLFQMPSPWLFGDAGRFLVTEEQKERITVAFASRHPALALALALGGVFALVGAVAGLMWALSPHSEPTAGDLLVMAVLIILPILAAVHVELRRKLHRIRPLLEGVPRSEERFSYRDRRNALFASMSITQMVGLGCLMTIVCAANVFALSDAAGAHPLLGDPRFIMRILTAVLFGTLGVTYFVWAAARLRRGRSGAGDLRN